MISRASAIVAALAVSAVGAAAAPALAVDGEILINQAKVNAGGITPADTPGFPATLSRPGRYKLTGNLVVPAGQRGIDVKRDDVTIDLNGFTISSNPPGAARVGVRAEGVTGLRVMNGTIAGFKGFGIYLAGMRGIVEEMRIVSSETGIRIVGARIRNSTIAAGRTGISCFGHCLIEMSLITDNTGSGIIVLDTGVVRGNVIVSNGSSGLVDADVTQGTGYGDNVLFGNNGGGAQVAGNVFQLHPNVCEPACP